MLINLKFRLMSHARAQLGQILLYAKCQHWRSHSLSERFLFFSHYPTAATGSKIQNETFILVYARTGICRGQGLSCKWDNKHNFRCRLMRALVKTYFGVVRTWEMRMKIRREQEIRPTVNRSTHQDLWVLANSHIINLLFLYNKCNICLMNRPTMPWRTVDGWHWKMLNCNPWIYYAAGCVCMPNANSAAIRNLANFVSKLHCDTT